MDLITLADVPELTGTEPKPRTTITIGRLDDNLRDPRYGKFAITQAQVDSWKRNLADTFGGQVAIDFDHSSDRGNGTRAAAWIRSIDQNGKLITADVEFSKRGARAVRNGDYKYTSPTFVADYSDEHGVKHGPALIGAALTNRPVLRKGMPTLSLSRDEFDGVAKVGKRKKAKSKSEAPRDSRRQMSKLTEIAKLLELDPEADEATILAKVTELKAPAPEPTPEPKHDTTGAMTLSADQYADLERRANLGEAAHAELLSEKFNTAWTKALSEGRAAPAQEENLRELHTLNPELAIKTLDSFVKIVPTKPTGSGESAAAGPAPAGMEDERYQLHTQAEQLAIKKLSENSNLDEGEAYILAINELEDSRTRQETGF